MTHLDWIRERGEQEFASGPAPLSTLSRIDTAARLRGVAEIRSGGVHSLALPLTEGPNLRQDGLPAFDVQTFFHQEPTGVFTDPAIGPGTDHVRLDAHGIDNTHIDALNHTAVDGRWYGGVATETPGLATLDDLALEGVVGRALHFDLAAVREADWISVEHPVADEDLRRALERTGRTIESGHVPMVDLGRDLSGGGHVGLCVAASLPIAGATGRNVNPKVIV